MLMIVGPLNTGVAAGGAGVATANATGTQKLSGLLLGFYIRYNDSPPAGTTDITIESVSGIEPNRTLIALSNAATDGYFPVLAQAKNPAGADSGQYANIPLVGAALKATIAQANNGDSADVWAYILGE